MVTYRVNNVPDFGCMEGSLLSYNLQPIPQGLAFQVKGQSPMITNFLKKNKFQASNGLFVDVAQYPEYKESELTIYLRGDDWTQNLKVDTTPFARDYVRDARKRQIEQALRELVSHVKKVSTPVWNYIPQPKMYSVPQPKTVWNCFPTYVF